MVAAAMAVGLVWPIAAAGDTGTVVTDCAPPLPIEKVVGSADLVFVGAVTNTTNAGRSATVAVKEVWHGDLPPEVTVTGGQDPTNPAEDDRTFETGTAYLFVPVLSGDHLVDSVCSSTMVWSDNLAAFRPPDAHAPDATTSLGPGGTSPGPGPLAFLGWLAGPLAMAAIIGGGVFGFALLVARRRDA